MAKQEMRTVEVSLPIALDDGLDELVILTGTSKRALIRDAVVAYLRPIGILAPAATEPTTPTLTRGKRNK